MPKRRTAAGIDTFVGGGFKHGATKPARQGRLFNGDDESTLANCFENRLGVERLEEAGVDYADFEAFSAEFLSSFDASGQASAPHATKTPVRSPVEDFASSEFQRSRGAIDFDGSRFGVTNRTRRIVLQCKIEHRWQVGRIAGCHDDHVRKDSQVTVVEHAMMRRTIGSRQTATIEHEGNREILQSDFLKDVIIGSLQKRAVNVHDRTHTHLGLSCGESNGVSFADASVEEPFGERLTNFFQLVAPDTWRLSSR